MENVSPTDSLENPTADVGLVIAVTTNVPDMFGAAIQHSLMLRVEVTGSLFVERTRTESF